MTMSSVGGGDMPLHEGAGYVNHHNIPVSAQQCHKCRFPCESSAGSLAMRPPEDVENSQEDPIGARTEKTRAMAVVPFGCCPFLVSVFSVAILDRVRSQFGVRRTLHLVAKRKASCGVSSARSWMNNPGPIRKTNWCNKGSTRILDRSTSA